MFTLSEILQALGNLNILNAIVVLGGTFGLFHYFNQSTKGRFKEIKNEMKEMKNEMKEMKEDIKSIDRRFTRLEGRFEERGYWESRIIPMDRLGPSKKKVKGE